MSLAQRNLLRHLTFSLPWGQRVADDNTPLWFYVLQEAESEESGERLGLVGGRIVAEVMLSLIEGDRKS